MKSYKDHFYSCYQLLLFLDVPYVVEGMLFLVFFSLPWMMGLQSTKDRWNARKVEFSLSGTNFSSLNLLQQIPLVLIGLLEPSISGIILAQVSSIYSQKWDFSKTLWKKKQKQASIRTILFNIVKKTHSFEYKYLSVFSFVNGGSIDLPSVYCTLSRFTL